VNQIELLRMNSKDHNNPMWSFTIFIKERITMKKLLTLALFSLTVQLGMAQTGTLKGKIVDAEYGDELMGAYVEKVGSGSGTITDMEGEFSLTLPIGKHEIRVIYQGFDNETRLVTIKEDEVAFIRVSMGEAENILSEAVKTAKRVKNTDNALIIMKQKSSIVFDGISAEQISRQSESNAAGALKRVTGVSVEGGKYVFVRGLGDRYSKTVLNGSVVPSLDPERNSVQMDMFPTNIINNVQVFKTFSPELPGDFAGGLINIETKDFPSKFFLQASASIGTNTQLLGNNTFLTYQGSATDGLGFDNGFRAMPESVRDTEVPNLYSDNQTLETQSKSFNNVMTTEDGKAGLNQSYGFSIGNQTKLRERPFGYYFGLNYRRSYAYYGEGNVGRYNAVSSSLLNPQFLLNDRRGDEQVMTGIFGNLHYKLNSKTTLGLSLMRNQSGRSTARFLEGQWAEDGSVSENQIFASQSLQYQQRTMNNAQLKVERDNGPEKSKLIWTSSATSSRQDEPDLRFIAYDYSIREDGTRNYRIQKNAYDLPARYYRNMDEFNWHNRLIITVPLEQKFDEKSELKFGVSHLLKDRTFNETRFSYFETDQFDGDLVKFFSAENMNINPYPSDNSSTFIIPFKGDDLINSYTGKQNVFAGFGQFDLPLFIDKFRVNGGLRVETTDMTVASLDKRQEKGELQNVDLLPALNIIYDAGNEDQVANLRFGYSRTLARPTFRELAPFASFFFTGDYVLVGNPNLVRTLIQNFDFRYEVFPKKGEYFSISAFYKSFENPIEKTQNPIASNTEITFTNVGDASLFGVEMEINKSLEFVNVHLKDFKIGFNGSLIKSQVEIDSLEFQVRSEIDVEASKTRPMYSQSPYIVNAYLGYKNDSSGTGVNLSYNVFGKRLALVSQGELPDVYEMPRPALDLSIFQNIGKRYVASISVKNILNPETRFTHNYGGRDYLYSSFKRGSSFSLGIKYKI